jgi:hypothetical protein
MREVVLRVGGPAVLCRPPPITRHPRQRQCDPGTEKIQKSHRREVIRMRMPDAGDEIATCDGRHKGRMRAVNHRSKERAKRAATKTSKLPSGLDLAMDFQQWLVAL